MSELHFNKESGYSDEKTIDNDEFSSTILQPFQKKTCGNESHEKETTKAVDGSVFLKVSEILQENTSAGGLFLIKLQVWRPGSLINRDSNTGGFPWNLQNFLKNTFFYRTPPVAASETKHIHASTDDILHVKIAIGANADIAKTKWEKQIFFCCREVDAMAIASAKSRSARETSRHPAFMGNCPTVSHTC